MSDEQPSRFQLRAAKRISSRDNALIRDLRHLVKDPRKGRLTGRALLEGPHLVDAYCRRGESPELLVVSDSGSLHPEIITLQSRCGPATETVLVPDQLFRDLSDLSSPLGVLALIEIPRDLPRETSGTCVMLDGLQDAGNVGTIMRTSAAAGIEDILLGRGCVAAWSQKVLRSAQGAHFSLRIREQVDLGDALSRFDGLRIAAVANSGKSVFEVSLKCKVAWVFGNEGSGVELELLDKVDIRATIPMAGDTESLNVAAAAAVCLFEQVRQQSGLAAGVST